MLKPRSVAPALIPTLSFLMLAGCTPMSYQPAVSARIELVPAIQTEYWKNGIPMSIDSSESMVVSLLAQESQLNPRKIELEVSIRNRSNSQLLVDPSQFSCRMYVKASSPDSSVTLLSSELANPDAEIAANHSEVNAVTAEQNPYALTRGETTLNHVNGVISFMNIFAYKKQSEERRQEVRDRDEELRQKERDRAEKEAEWNRYHQIALRTAQQSSELKSSQILRKTTLLPNESVSGKVYFIGNRIADNAVFSIVLNNETISFPYNQTR